MFKLVLIGIVLCLSVMRVAAQSVPTESPTILRLAIQKSKLDTNRISLQLKLGNYYINKEGEYKNDLDSAISFFNQAAQLSIKLHEVDWQYKAQGMIGSYYAEAGDLVRCRQCFMRAITYYQRTGNISKEAYYWGWLGDLYDNTAKNDYQDERMGYYQHARLLYLQNHQAADAANILSHIASIHTEKKQFALAENELKQALTEFKAAGYKKLGYTCHQLYVLEYAKGHYNTAMEFCLQGINSITASGDPNLATQLYQAAWECTYAEKKNEEAMAWLQKLISVDTQPFTAKCWMIQLLLEMNRIKEARLMLNEVSKGGTPRDLADKFTLYRANALYYSAIGKNDLAVQYDLKILESNSKTPYGEKFYYEWSMIVDNHITGIYLGTNQAAKAKKYLNDVALIFKTSKMPLDPRALKAFYDHLYKYNVAIGNYREAVKNLERRDRLQDSLFTIATNNRVSELDIKYQSAQKEESIKTLHNQSAVQQARVEKANLQRNITIAGILVMILISALFYRNYRQKQTTNNIITHKNELLQHLLTEKEWLLKEVHHRVKNNLHTVICLLESQARYLENDALKAIESSQHRIYAMSLIHQKLYQSDDIKTIDMAIYILELVKSLEDSFDVSNQIQFKLNVQRVNLDISYAIPLGLIINEAVTNSIKYAFPGDRKGEISVLMLNDDDRIKLVLADNGIGMPPINFDVESESLGLRLMKGLSEDIDAVIRFEVDNGTRISITFNPDTLNNPENLLKSTEIKEA